MSESDLAIAFLETARGALLEWFREHRRDLPWRRTSDPYRILVSEIMLQQTRVETVLRYYDRFLERFPSVDVLAQAEEQQVLAQWSGLGYYRRARHLHAAAKAIVERGEFPRSVAKLKELPGVGGYTAAAVASIAFGEGVAVVDGNVERVVARLLALEQDPKRQPGRGIVAQGAAALLDERHAGDSNQAMMELGATVCLPTAPRCLLCPLAEFCRAREVARPESYPLRAERSRPTRERWLVAVVQDDGRLLLVQRGEREAVLPGMWELPWVETVVEGSWSRTRIEVELSRRYGGEWSLRETRGEVKHGITTRAITAEVRDAVFAPTADEVAEARGSRLGWWSSAELETLARTAMVDKVLRALGER